MCFNDSPASARWHMCLSGGTHLFRRLMFSGLKTSLWDTLPLVITSSLCTDSTTALKDEKREIKNNRFMTNVEKKKPNSCYATLQVSHVRFLVTMDTKQRAKLCHSQIQPTIDDVVQCRERKIEYLNV